MRKSNTARRLTLLVAGLALIATTAHAADPFRSGVANAEYGSGNTTSDSDANTGFLDPVGSTGLASVSRPKINPPPASTIDIEAIATVNQPAGVLTARAAQSSTSDRNDDPRSWFVFGGSRMNLGDTATVSSSTLPDGTPVDVTFGIAIAWAANHTIDTKGLVNNTNTAFRLSAQFTGNAGMDGSFFMPSNDNQRNFQTEFGLDITDGLFAGPAFAEFTLSTSVGATIDYGIAIAADAFGDVIGTELGGGINPEISSFAEIVGVYGAEASLPDAVVAPAALSFSSLADTPPIPDVQLLIAGPNGPTPIVGLDNVNPDYAASFLTSVDDPGDPGTPPDDNGKVIPTPTAAGLFLAGFVCVLRRRSPRVG